MYYDYRLHSQSEDAIIRCKKKKSPPTTQASWAFVHTV